MRTYVRYKASQLALHSLTAALFQLGCCLVSVLQQLDCTCQQQVVQGTCRACACITLLCQTTASCSPRWLRVQQPTCLQELQQARQRAAA